LGIRTRVEKSGFLFAKNENCTSFSKGDKGAEMEHDGPKMKGDTRRKKEDHYYESAGTEPLRRSNTSITNTLEKKYICGRNGIKVGKGRLSKKESWSKGSTGQKD